MWEQLTSYGYVLTRTTEVDNGYVHHSHGYGYWTCRYLCRLLPSAFGYCDAETIIEPRAKFMKILYDVYGGAIVLYGDAIAVNESAVSIY